jgi:hypothetical protein
LASQDRRIFARRLQRRLYRDFFPSEFNEKTQTRKCPTRNSQFDALVRPHYFKTWDLKKNIFLWLKIKHILWYLVTSLLLTESVFSNVNWQTHRINLSKRVIKRNGSHNLQAQRTSICSKTLRHPVRCLTCCWDGLIMLYRQPTFQIFTDRTLSRASTWVSLQEVLSGSHDFFFGPWPQDADVPLTRELTLRLDVLHIYL